jgi:hypothetical protein
MVKSIQNLSDIQAKKPQAISKKPTSEAPKAGSPDKHKGPDIAVRAPETTRNLDLKLSPTIALGLFFEVDQLTTVIRITYVS